MPFNPSAPVEELELPSGAVGAFDPSQPVEEMEVPAGAPGAFDPSKPFEVDASTVGNPREVADGIADAIGTALSVSSGMPKPLTNLLLRTGGKKTDIALNTLLPMAGGAVGTVVGTPGAGTMIGGGAGGLAGESLVELRQILRGERQTFSPGSLIGTTAVSAVVPKPIRAAGSALKTAGKTLVQRGAEGAKLGGAQEVIREVIDEGELSLGDIVENALWGSAFGTAFGGLEAVAPAVFKAIRRKPPREAATILREEGSAPAAAVANQIDANLASGKVDIAPLPTEAPVVTAESVAKMTPDEFFEFSKDGGITNKAQAVGEATTDPKQIEFLAEQGRLANAEARALVEAKDFDGLQKVMVKEQFFNEAHQAATKSAPFATDAPAAPDVGLGAASPKEFQPVNKSITGIKNETVDLQRAERGLPPLMSEARKDLGATWDDAMKRIDDDQNAADKLLNDFRTKPKALTDVETAILLHREIELRNQFDQVTRNLDENIGTPDSLASDRATQARVLDELNELESVSRQAGTETGRGLNARKLMAAEDFSLAQMLTKRRAAKGGVKLTPEEEAQVKTQHDAINEAQRALDQHEAQLELDDAVGTPEATAERINKLEGDLTKSTQGKSGEVFRKRIEKRIEDLKRRAKEGDFSKKPAPRNRALDEEGNLLQAKLEEAKDDFRAAMERDKFERMTTKEKMLSRVADSWDLARNFVTTGEFSTLLRQGFVQAMSHPIRTAKTFGKSLKALFADKATARALDLETLNDPSVPVAREAGVHFDQEGARLSAREETVASRFGEELWGIRHFNQQSRVFLNKLRLDAFNSIKNSNPSLTKDDLVQVAKFVNESTGRGSLNKWGERNAQALNRVLFSARFQAARVQMLTGHSMWGGSAASRAAIAKEYVRTLIGIATVYGLYNIGFADDKEDGFKPVSFDPRASNFGKMRVGNTEIDPLAGFSQWIVYGTRSGLTLANSAGIDTGAQYVTGTGREIDLRNPSSPYDPDWLDVSIRFGRSKLHPIVGAGVSGMLGEDPVGNPTTWKREALGFTHPMSYEDIWFAMEDLGVERGTAVSILAMLGAGVNTFEKNEKKAMGTPRNPVDEINRKIREDAAKEQVTLPSGKKVNVRPAK